MVREAGRPERSGAETAAGRRKGPDSEAEARRRKGAAA
ncbi:hypothetical protein SUDANB96_03190 [Streptomyces sp. enrichment culture]